PSLRFMSSPTPYHHYLFLFNALASSQIYTLSLHDALPIFSEYKRFHLTMSYVVSAMKLRSRAPQRLSRLRVFSITLSAYSPSLKISPRASTVAKTRFLYKRIELF